jgi:hypothetical protein
MSALRCDGKVRHPSKGAADAHLRSVKRLPGYELYGGESYPCVKCRDWHVGRRKIGAHVN